jgi:hypothetical protein
LGEYYDYSSKNGGYEEDSNDSNEYDHCDCLKANPLLVNTEKCRKGLDQDSFNDGKKSKRSAETFENWNYNWRHSSCLSTLNGFQMDSASIVNF